MKAKVYKDNGYTHVLVEITNFANKPEITKGFKSYYEMRKAKNRMSLHEINSNIFSFMSVIRLLIVVFK
jgi:hypothetical protein